MPLPDAVPKPAGSNIYHQLNSTKLGDLTNAEFAIVRDPLFLNEVSEDELRRLALIGHARQSFSASSSGPISGKGDVVTYTQASSSVSITVKPPPGEVWQIIAISVTNSVSPTGSIGYSLFLSSKDMITAEPLKPDASNDLYYSNTSSGSTNIQWETLVEDHNAQPFIVTETMMLRAYSDFANAGVGNTVNWKVAYVVLR